MATLIEGAGCDRICGAADTLSFARDQDIVVILMAI